MAKWALRIGTSLGILVYILVDVNRDHLWRALTGVRLGWVAVAVAVYVVGQVLSALKWSMLGRSVGLAGSSLDYGRYYFIGMFFNLLGVSTLGGDVVRGLYLGRGRRPGLALNSVLFDRVSGLAILMALGSVTMLAYPEYQYAGALGLTIMAGGLALVVGWWTCPRLVKLLPQDNYVRRQVEHELAPFWRDSRLLVRVAGVSLVFHLSQVCVQWLLCKAAGATVPFTYCLVFHPVLSVMMALPVSVSGFGVREGGYLYFLGLLNVDDSIAVTVGLLWWAVTVVTGLMGGAIFFATGAQLPKLRVRRQEEQQATALG
jgi:glycosyltransferase 2 family protein